MSIDLYCGDCRELIKQIPEHSIDLIFTDPPYPTEFLYLYEWLADVSPLVLKDTGFVAMYVGCYHFANVMRLLDGKLEYFMELIIFGSGFGSMMWNRRVIGKHKSIMLFRPIGGIGMPRCNMTSVFTGTSSDKRFHAWGQDEASARYYVDCLTKRGDMVLDPFVGGGTTPAMCKVLDRNCIGFELEKKTYDIARERVISQQMPLNHEMVSNQECMV